mgnify:CR=1 FL=1
MKFDWYSFPKQFNSEQLAQIRAPFQHTEQEDNGVKLRHTARAWFRDVHPHIATLYDKCTLTNDYYWGYDCWQNHATDECLLNTYTVGERYDWHVDKTQDTVMDQKLTILINVSDAPYKGGELEFMIDKCYPVQFNPGDAVMFRSLLLHRVTPVTEGARQSVTIWMKGPAFR